MTTTNVYRLRSREIMYLVSSVRLSVCVSIRALLVEPFDQGQRSMSNIKVEVKCLGRIQCTCMPSSYDYCWKSLLLFLCFIKTHRQTDWVAPSVDVVDRLLIRRKPSRAGHEEVKVFCFNSSSYKNEVMSWMHFRGQLPFPLVYSWITQRSNL